MLGMMVMTAYREKQ